MSEHEQPPAFTGQQINLFCSDVERAVAFYCALGFAERFRTPPAGSPAQVEVDGPATRIGLTSAAVANDEFGLAVQPGRNSAELVFWCTDADAAFTTALAAGGRMHQPMQDSPDGRLRYGWVFDPDGHQLKFVQQR
jgi:uncharacterized glyoxalase superfamily protein PhnB